MGMTEMVVMTAFGPLILCAQGLAIRQGVKQREQVANCGWCLPEEE